MIRTRLAPTPSGYLHVGNAWSFVIAWLAARSRGGRVHLRIDDLDAARLRPEYLEDIFASLDWLGLDYDSGPRDPGDFRARHSQRLRLDQYQSALDRLLTLRVGDGDLVYACACSRGQARRTALAADAGASSSPSPAGAKTGLYPGTCRSLGLDRGPGERSLRLRVPGNTEVTLRDLASGNLELRPGRDMGDFVLRQRNGDPAYQLASVVDDAALGINFVVRGLDLLPSTGAQLLLARHLGLVPFQQANFLHHGLVLAPGGADKLSKSAGTSLAHGDMSLKALRQRLPGPEALYRFFAAALGLEAEGKTGARDLLAGFAPERVPTAPLRWEDFVRDAGL